MRVRLPLAKLESVVVIDGYTLGSKEILVISLLF